MYPAPRDISTEIYARMPEEFYRFGHRSDWLERRGAPPAHSFLEGPSFDRAGNLYVVDLAHGRIFRIARDRSWQVFADYDGEPNGLKIHKDGRIFVADHQHGIVTFDPLTGNRIESTEGWGVYGFAGLNDLTFSMNGDLYVTDQGTSGYEDPSGKVFRLRVTGERDLVSGGHLSPNGLVLDRSDTVLHTAMTRSNQIMSFPLRPNQGGSPRARMFLQLSGGLIGPDGMALDQDGNISVVHAGSGTVWQFSEHGEPLARIRSCAGLRTTNIAYGMDEADTSSLYVTEAEQGVILRAKLTVPGRLVYGLS